MWRGAVVCVRGCVWAVVCVVGMVSSVWEVGGAMSGGISEIGW